MKLKRKAIDSFFKKIDAVPPDPGQNDLIVPCIDDLDDEAAAWLAAQEEEEEEEEDNNEEVEEVPRQPPPKVQRFNSEGVSVLVVERDPGLRCQIWDYPLDDQDQVVTAYMKHGPYQFVKDTYPLSGPKKHQRRFQSHWFKAFSWLEYSPTKDAAFCFPCFLFSKKPTGKVGSDAFTLKGFRSWKKVNDGDRCAFLTHMGKDCNSAHRYSVQCV
ncbi:hypothetical protein ACP70R_006792 [Stipagrostis hirtigluma subsp. patula]